MSLLALPLEIFQQVLFETVTYDNFAGLRLVHSQFEKTIRGCAEQLMRRLVHVQKVSVHVLSLHQCSNGEKGAADAGEQKLISLLRLYKDMATCVQLEETLETHREKFTAFPIWADVPVKGFGSLGSVLIFSAFRRELLRSMQAADDSSSPTTIARADSSNEHFEWLKLDQHFMDFVRVQMTVEDLQALMTIVNFCAISTRFIDTILTSRYYFNDAGASDHWQNEQLGSALLAERILWRGPSWLAQELHQNPQLEAPAILAQQHNKPTTPDDHTMWNGSRAEAARLAANGVTRFLWRERIRKLERERIDAEQHGMERKIERQELRLDSAVWRGSAGG